MNDSEKLDKILEKVNSLETKATASEIYQRQQRKELDSLQLKVEKHEANQNKFFGLLSAFGLAATAFFSWLFNTK